MVSALIVFALCASCSFSSGSQEPQATPDETPSPMHENRLAKESSPYLRQHAHNPVDWYPWGPEALALAKKLDKPIFLSVGYSSCHWCHVMAEESFEDAETAKLMNELYVCVKVDREERPDIDEIYMAATQAMTGSGGWPMSVWMTPDLVPFYAGTYFPPERSRGLPAFRDVLQGVSKIYTEERENVDQTAKQIKDALQQRLAPPARPGEPSHSFAEALAESAAERFDPEHGGFGSPARGGAPARYAPKFPHPAELGALMREAARTGDAKTKAIVEQTLEGMAMGGMYDQLGGGFHRYSTDRMWLVPHFEKMLYDNALLARLYAEAWVWTGNPLYERIARETLDYMAREMQGPHGGFYSTTDAQSEGVEGKFFVWQKAEVMAICAPDGELACLHWGVVDDGNWEHVNVLSRAMEPAQIAEQLDRELEDVEAALARCREKLLAARSQRVPPALDDKVITSWNGMAIAAMAYGHQVFGEPRYRESAQRAAAFVEANLRDGDRLHRTWRAVDGREQAKFEGYLEDYGFYTEGLLALFQSDFDPRWLTAARELLGTVQAHFGDPADGSFFVTPDDHEELLARSKSILESAIPSGGAMVIQALLRAGLLLGDRDLDSAAERALTANFDMLSRHPIGCPSLVQAVQLHLGEPTEVVIAGDIADPATAALLHAARHQFPPHSVVIHVDEARRDELAAATPLVEGKTPVDGQPAAYVCRRGVCEAPVTDPAALRR